MSYVNQNSSVDEVMFASLEDDDSDETESVNVCSTCEVECPKKADMTCTKCEQTPCKQKGQAGHEGAFINVVNNDGTMINCGKKKTGDSVTEYTFLKKFLEYSKKSIHFKEFLPFMPYTSEITQDGEIKYKLNLCTKDNVDYMIIKNAKTGLKNPVTLDFKIGKKTAFAEDSNEDKENTHRTYLDEPFSKKGYRLEGATDINFTRNVLSKKDMMAKAFKIFTKKKKFLNYPLNPEDIYPIFLRGDIIRDSSTEDQINLYDALMSFKEKITNLSYIIKRNKNNITNTNDNVCFIGSSVLLVRGINNNKQEFRIKLIDFAHPYIRVKSENKGFQDDTTKNEPSDEIYNKYLENYNEGLLNFIDKLLKYVNDYISRLKILPNVKQYIEYIEYIKVYDNLGGSRKLRKLKKSSRKKNSRRRKKVTRRINKRGGRRITKRNKKHKRKRRIKSRRRK